MKTLKYYIPFILFFMSTHNTFSQVYLGGGYAYSMLSENSFDAVKGLAINIQRDYSIGNGKWHVSPALQVSLLSSNTTREVYSFYATTLSIAPVVSYDLLKFSRFVIAPYAAPFAGWLLGLRSGDIVFESAYLNELTWGAQFGLDFQVNISEDFQLKLLPLNLQYGNEFFRQGTVSLLFRL